MNAAVCIPYRPVDERRRRNYELVARYWEQTGWPVYTGDSDGETFDRAQAVNNAAAKAAGADVLVISDCDIYPTTVWQAEEACAAALELYAYVVTFNPLLVLSEKGTRVLGEGRSIPDEEIAETSAGLWIASFAVPLALFVECGGMDERFRAYGGEDIAFLMAVTTFGNPQTRVESPAYHLAHDPMDKAHPLAVANRGLAKRYRKAQGNRERMRSLIAERLS